jgi:hypothetical protein
MTLFVIDHVKKEIKWMLEDGFIKPTRYAE